MLSKSDYKYYEKAKIVADLSDYKKAYTKYVSKYVEFKEGILEINVKWADGTVTPAPMY